MSLWSPAVSRVMGLMKWVSNKMIRAAHCKRLWQPMPLALQAAHVELWRSLSHWSALPGPCQNLCLYKAFRRQHIGAQSTGGANKPPD